MAIAPVAIASRGITGERDPSRIKTGDLFFADNVDFSSGNLVQKVGGSIKVNSTVLSGAPSVLTGSYYLPTPSTTRRVIVTSDKKLYKDDMTGTFGTTLATLANSFTTAQVVPAGIEVAGNSRKLFFFTGTNAVQVLTADGATTTAISGPPAEWSGSNQPNFGFMLRGSIVASGHTTDPSRLYVSSVTSHETFTGAGTTSINVYPGQPVGGKLVAGISSLSRAFIWKNPEGIYWINDSDLSSVNWFAQPATMQFGAAPTPHAVVQVDQGTVAFISNIGDIVLMQETSGSLSGVQFINITKALNLREFMRDNFNIGRLANAQLKWYEEKKQLWVLMAAAGASSETRQLVVDFNEERTRVHTVSKDTAESMWFEPDSENIYRPVIGDNAGFVWQTDQNTRSVAGTTYQMRIFTTPADFSDIDKQYMVKKLFYRLHLEYEPSGNYDVSCDITIDGKTFGTVAFNQNTEPAELPFVLPAILGGPGLKRRSKDIGGEGYYISLIFRESTDHNPKLARAWVEFEPLVPAP